MHPSGMLSCYLIFHKFQTFKIKFSSGSAGQRDHRRIDFMFLLPPPPPPPPPDGYATEITSVRTLLAWHTSLAYMYSYRYGYTILSKNSMILHVDLCLIQVILKIRQNWHNISIKVFFQQQNKLPLLGLDRRIIDVWVQCSAYRAILTLFARLRLKILTFYWFSLAAWIQKSSHQPHVNFALLANNSNAWIQYLIYIRPLNVIVNIYNNASLRKSWP